jgi:putative aldouronate transport system substrate-binding protein
MDGFGEYLETMRQWYSEGLIDPNFTSFNYYLNTPNSVENNQHVLYSLILSAFTGNNYFQMHMCNNEPEYLQPIVAPAVNEGDKTVQAGRRVIAKDEIYITTGCKNPELAAKWLDFQYSKEGELLNWYGIEDVTYTMDSEGHPQFTDLVLQDPNGLPPSQVMEKYALNWGNCWLGKHNTVASEKVATFAAGGNNQQKDAVDIWSVPEINVELPMGVSLTEDENDEVSVKLTAVKTMIEEYMVNYIIGTTDTSFEDFKAQLGTYGYNEVIDIYQAALDRYNAR